MYNIYDVLQIIFNKSIFLRCCFNIKNIRIYIVFEVGNFFNILYYVRIEF